jgi:hypothetical protein
VVVLAAALAACAGRASTVRVTSPFTEEDAEVFDDGIDYVGDPSGLEGPWHDSWRRDLQLRVGRADLIAAVTVRTLRIDVDLDRRQTARLVTTVGEVLAGSPPGTEVVLVVREGQMGFSTVHGNDHRILDQTFVAYVKWAQGDAGEVVPRWHLAPASPGVVDETRELIRMKRAGAESQPRRVVHQH